MSGFAIRYPFFIIMLCLVIAVVGSTTVARMPVDLFPDINIPVVVVATFYNGMPPEQIESNITNPFERFFTLGSGIDHIESRSLTGVSLIRVYFQPGTNADSAVTTISNLAMAQLRRLPPGTLPPVVLKFDASSLPVCLITLKGQGLNETQLHDLAQFNVRNQLAGVPGASVPQPFGGKYRQIQIYVDPVKLEAHQLSPMDIVRSVNQANSILPAGDVRIGPRDFNIYTNSQFPDTEQIDRLPLKTVGNGQLLISDVGHAKDAAAIQTNIVRVDGQHSVYLPILKQGGGSNTIAVVNGIRVAISDLLDIPKSLRTKVVFDQSVFVKTAISNLGSEGGIGLVLTALMILIFLGNVRATFAVMLSIPLSALAAFLALNLMGGTINSMVLGGLALAFSRLIDNSVVVLENIFRHLEMGESPEKAAEKGGQEVALPVLAATFTTAIVFFPVVFLYGVSRFLFTALALSVVLSLFASYFVAMTVVPLFCARFIKNAHNEAAHHKGGSWFQRFVLWFNRKYDQGLMRYDIAVAKSLVRPAATVLGVLGVFLFSLGLFPFMGLSFFPRTDPGQFVINVKAPSGTRLELTDDYVARVEQDIRSVVPASDLGMIVSNIGITPDFSAIYTSNSGQHTAFVQVSLKEGHQKSSFAYMNLVRDKLHNDLPELSTYFQTGGLVDAVVNLGLPAPIDIQVSGNNQQEAFATASSLANRIKGIRGVSDVLIPQDLDYPGLRLDVNREMAGRLGLTSSEIIDNVITALTSNGMIAPSYYVDPKSGNNYLLTVQFPETAVKSLTDFQQIPMHSKDGSQTTNLGAVTDLTAMNTPTEVDHYQLRRTIDIYVSPSGQDLGGLAKQVDKAIADQHAPSDLRITMRGSVEGMRKSFSSFSIGLVLSIILVYLILMAQFASFMDPLIILLAIPPGITGVILLLLATGTTLNVMSLMGVVMMTGIVVSNSILIVEFTRSLRREGMPIREAVALACRVRLRPVLMTSLATILGMIPMALALEAGSEQYAPLARSIIGGLTVSVLVTVFVVPAAYLWVHRREEEHAMKPLPRGCAMTTRRLTSFLCLVCVCVVGLAQVPDPSNAQPLTLQQAEQIAKQNNPRISTARLVALGLAQVTREVRSAELPTATGNITAVDSHQGSRITAGALNNPTVYQRAAGGVTVAQLISDFGRTRSLVRSASLRAQAQASSATATEADITLAVDEAFYRALGADAVLKVANDTVAARATTQDQVNALTGAKLKSTLDLSFANVNLEQAKLLLLDAQNASQDAMNTLNSLLGNEQPAVYRLVDETPQTPPLPPTDPEPLVGEAMKDRPDLASLNEQFEANRSFATAEHKLNLPTLSALAAAGSTPVRADLITSSWYGAAGVNLSIPIFNGFLFSARAQEADLRAAAAQSEVKTLRQEIARVVRITVLQAQSNFQRIAVTQQLLDAANQAFDLAQTRYTIGLSSIVELSQAQLAQTEAQINFATARYSYQGSLAALRYQTGQ